MARSPNDPSFNPPAPRPGLTFGPSATNAYDTFKTGIVGAGGGSGLGFGKSVTGFNPFDFTTGPAVTGFDVIPPTVSFPGPPAPPPGTGIGAGLIDSIIAGLGGFTTDGGASTSSPGVSVADITGAAGSPVGPVVSPVTTDGGVGFLDQLKTLAGGLLNGIGAQPDTVEVTPVMGSTGVGGSSGRNNNSVLIGLGIAAAVAFFALKK